jgi:hypothetical protein
MQEYLRITGKQFTKKFRCQYSSFQYSIRRPGDVNISILGRTVVFMNMPYRVISGRFVLYDDDSPEYGNVDDLKYFSDELLNVVLPDGTAMKMVFVGDINIVYDDPYGKVKFADFVLQEVVQ